MVEKLINQEKEWTDKQVNDLKELIMEDRQRQVDLIKKTLIDTQWFNDLYKERSTQMYNMMKPLQDTLTHIQATAQLSLPDISYRFNIPEKIFTGIDSAALYSSVISGAITDLQKVHNTWLDNMIWDTFAHIQETAKLSLTNISRHLSISEKLFTGIEDNLLKLAIPNDIISHALGTFTNFTTSYERLVSSIKSFPQLVELPSFALPRASLDVFTTGYAISKLCPDNDKTKKGEEACLIVESEQEVTACVDLLEKVNPAFAKLYIGANDAFVSGGADWKRHVLVSLRELWNHIIQYLAPNEQVIPWVPKGDNKYLQEGRPTRKARVLYICRKINHGPFSEFVLQDIQALLELFNIFQRVHELEPNLSEEQLKALVIRTTTQLIFILKICNSTK